VGRAEEVTPHHGEHVSAGAEEHGVSADALGTLGASPIAAANSNDAKRRRVMLISYALW
jgi:hypothetical protein